VTVTASNAERFLNAFNEDRLAEQQGRRKTSKDWPAFGELLENSNLLTDHKNRLRHYSKLRNVIVHNTSVGNKAIADPRDDVVAAIEKIRNLLFRPPLLVATLREYGRPKVFELEDDIGEFLTLVVEHEFSQAPVRSGDGYRLLTTNAVARHFAPSLIKHGLVETATIGEVLASAELGDRLETLNPSATVLDAINLFSGQASTTEEPPAALLVLDATKEHLPQALCTRADLALLYAQLEI
jgi:hypothetical protein